jgi:uncharacterized damage-inducible protein DinB
VLIFDPLKLDFQSIFRRFALMESAQGAIKLIAHTASLLPTLFAQKSWVNNELFNQLATVTTPEQLKENISFQFTDGDVGRMTREKMLAHIITHGPYHRGNVGQILKSISVVSPRD